MLHSLLYRQYHHRVLSEICVLAEVSKNLNANIGCDGENEVIKAVIADCNALREEYTVLNPNAEPEYLAKQNALITKLRDQQKKFYHEQFLSQYCNHKNHGEIIYYLTTLMQRNTELDIFIQAGTRKLPDDFKKRLVIFREKFVERFLNLTGITALPMFIMECIDDLMVNLIKTYNSDTTTAAIFLPIFFNDKTLDIETGMKIFLGEVLVPLVIEAVKHNKNLQSLTLRSILLQEKDKDALLSMLSSLKNLKYLQMAICCSAFDAEYPENMCVETFSYIIATVLEKNNNLFALDISGNYLDTVAMNTLGKALAHNVNLRALSLRSCNIDAEAAIILCEALAINDTLRCLNLQFNNIADNGAVAISQVLSEHHALYYLDIFGNNITPVGLMAFAKVITANNNLIKLSLGGSEYSDAVGKKLMTAMATNTNSRLNPDLSPDILDAMYNNRVNLGEPLNIDISQFFSIIEDKFFNKLQVNFNIEDNYRLTLEYSLYEKIIFDYDNMYCTQYGLNEQFESCWHDCSKYRYRNIFLMAWFDYMNFRERMLECRAMFRVMTEIGHELVLMPNELEHDTTLAEPGKVYLKATGEYIVRDLHGQVARGSLLYGAHAVPTLDCSKLVNELNNVDFKEKVLAITSIRGQTKNVKRIPPSVACDVLEFMPHFRQFSKNIKYNIIFKSSFETEKEQREIITRAKRKRKCSEFKG